MNQGQITRKFLGKLVGKTEWAVKSYFARHNLSKDNHDHVREYLNKFMK